MSERGDLADSVKIKRQGSVKVDSGYWDIKIS